MCEESRSLTHETLRVLGYQSQHSIRMSKFRCLSTLYVRCLVPAARVERKQFEFRPSAVQGSNYINFPWMELKDKIMLPDIEIIVGTYTDFLLGYQLLQNDDKVQLKATFADKSHAGSLKCVAVQGPWVASGGSDDRIFIYDMRTRKQSYILHSHTGTVNAVVFSPDLTHLLSASADGHMMATRVGTWTTEGDWRKAHAGSPVTHIACHPSSRLALSLGGDQILNTWNLVKGRVAYRTNLKSKRTLGSSPDCLSWSTDGKHFTLSGPLAIEIWNIETASVLRHTKTPSKPICVAWLSEVDCLVGLENGSIAWISLAAEDDTPPTLIVAHETRVKGMAYLNEALVTISSAGEIKIWSCNIEEKQLKQIASGNIDCRPTCLALLDTKQFGKPSQAQPNADLANQHVQKPQLQPQTSKQEEAELELLKPRTFVSIEYDGDAKDAEVNASDNDDEEDESSNDDEAKKAKPKSKSKSKSNKAAAARDSSDSEDDLVSDDDSEEEEDSEIDSHSDSESDSERRTRPKQKANKRQAQANNKSRAKQAKKK